MSKFIKIALLALCLTGGFSAFAKNDSLGQNDDFLNKQCGVVDSQKQDGKEGGGTKVADPCRGKTGQALTDCKASQAVVQ